MTLWADTTAVSVPTLAASSPSGRKNFAGGLTATSVELSVPSTSTTWNLFSTFRTLHNIAKTLPPPSSTSIVGSWIVHKAVALSPSVPRILTKPADMKAGTYYPGLVNTLLEGIGTVTTTTYFLRGWDTNGNFVYWSSTATPNLSPVTTIPTLVGSLTNICLIGTTTT